METITVLDLDPITATLWGFYLGFAFLVIAVGLLMWRVGRLEKRMRDVIEAIHINRREIF